MTIILTLFAYNDQDLRILINSYWIVWVSVLLLWKYHHSHPTSPLEIITFTWIWIYCFPNLPWRECSSLGAALALESKTRNMRHMEENMLILMLVSVWLNTCCLVNYRYFYVWNVSNCPATSSTQLTSWNLNAHTSHTSMYQWAPPGSTPEQTAAS